jgi:hypothetical protein
VAEGVKRPGAKAVSFPADLKAGVEKLAKLHVEHPQSTLSHGWFRNPDVKTHRARKEPYVQSYWRIYPVSLS